MRVVFGIGNPGPEYEGTRHNLGFEVLDRLAERARARFSARRGEAALRAGILVGGEPVLLVKPLTYVNRCGPLLAAIRCGEGLDLDALLVVVDDFQLPLGRLRLRGRGSDGGHNGLASILVHLGTQAVPRLRVGIGGPGAVPTRDFVLSRFTPREREAADTAVARAVEGVRCWIRLGLERAMSAVNRRDLDQPGDGA